MGGPPHFARAILVGTQIGVGSIDAPSFREARLAEHFDAVSLGYGIAIARAGDEVRGRKRSEDLFVQFALEIGDTD